jgi:hypothetical protein
MGRSLISLMMHRSIINLIHQIGDPRSRGQLDTLDHALQIRPVDIGYIYRVYLEGTSIGYIYRVYL